MEKNYSKLKKKIPKTEGTTSYMNSLKRKPKNYKRRDILSVLIKILNKYLVSE